jgi:hypothetical protein
LHSEEQAERTPEQQLKIEKLKEKIGKAEQEVHFVNYSIKVELKKADQGKTDNPQTR